MDHSPWLEEGKKRDHSPWLEEEEKKTMVDGP